MFISLKDAKTSVTHSRIVVSVPLSSQQLMLLEQINQFAVHQAQYNHEVRQLPAKMFYKVNEELKLALVALLTTCALLDPKRGGNEEMTFFEKQIKIIQTTPHVKTIDFGKIRPQLVQQSFIPEIINDWFLYRDVNGDGIHALMDKKTYLQGLSSYAKGGHPVYEFARFYREFMKHKLHKQQKQNEKIQDMAIKSLIDKTIQQQLEYGHSPQDLLNSITNDGYTTLLSDQADIPTRKALPKK